MTRNDFIKTVTELLNQYIFEGVEPENIQLRVNPASLTVALVSNEVFLSELADSEEAVEEAAGAERSESKEATDRQVSQNPDFYPVFTLIKKGADGKFVVDQEAVAKLAANYPTAK